MPRKLLSVALDAATVEMLDLPQGHSVSFRDGLPTNDDGLAFYISQLSSLESRVYETKYRNIVYQDLIPIDTSDPEWIETVDYISYDAVTSGKFIGSNARDLPQSDINYSKTTIPVFYGGNSYAYSLDELRKSQALGRGVDVTKASASRRGFEEHAQRVAFKGDADRGITGLFNNANVQLDTSTVNWDTATGQEIVADCNALLTKIWINSKETHVPGRLLLPSSRYAVLTSKRMDTGTDTTVLEYLRQNNIYTSMTNQPLEIRPLFELNTAGAGGTPRMIAQEVNDENFGMKMPIPWRSIAPQPDGLGVFVPAEYKFGGVFFRYPGSAAYRDFL